MDRPVLIGNSMTSDEDSCSDDSNMDLNLFLSNNEADVLDIEMLEAFSHAFPKKQGETQISASSFVWRTAVKNGHIEQLDRVLSSASDTITILQNLINSPQTSNENYQRIKKDLFHSFQMVPTSLNHGAQPLYLRALRDHMMRWDPDIRNVVDETCRHVFNLTFDQMLIRHPRWIAERTPRHVPQPSILVPAIQFVFKTFGNAIDATTKQPLFSQLAWKKAEAVIELARQGYLSDIEGVPMYERAQMDKYGLQKWICLRGTNNVEGGPHGDIYRKFAALNAGPRLTVNCLQDHRSWYNLQAFAKHLYGVDWEYHHNLGLINRTAFLLNYLADVMDGASSYSQRVNGDLYEKTTEQFGICRVPDGLRTRLCMEPYSEHAATVFCKLSASDDWLHRCQGLALPVLPPTTLPAQQYFFSQICDFAAADSADGKKHIDWEAFACQWNQTADGKDRVYITAEVLAAYGKTWDKANNIRASQELISGELDDIQRTKEVLQPLICHSQPS
ncbi:hypothetical protein C0992_008530 [Termitomyces sp. T32_za158]|nr:hypothetical protein C0992_008530 [Termitomyces sp. T32_za158]